MKWTRKRFSDGQPYYVNSFGDQIVSEGWRSHQRLFSLLMKNKGGYRHYGTLRGAKRAAEKERKQGG